MNYTPPFDENTPPPAIPLPPVAQAFLDRNPLIEAVIRGVARELDPSASLSLARFIPGLNMDIRVRYDHERRSLVVIPQPGSA